jgi:hypothetical protein
VLCGGLGWVRAVGRGFGRPAEGSGGRQRDCPCGERVSARNAGVRSVRVSARCVSAWRGSAWRGSAQRGCPAPARVASPSANTDPASLAWVTCPCPRCCTGKAQFDRQSDPCPTNLPLPKLLHRQSAVRSAKWPVAPRSAGCHITSVNLAQRTCPCLSCRVGKAPSRSAKAELVRARRTLPPTPAKFLPNVEPAKHS